MLPEGCDCDASWTAPNKMGFSKPGVVVEYVTSLVIRVGDVILHTTNDIQIAMSGQINHK